MKSFHVLAAVLVLVMLMAAFPRLFGIMQKPVEKPPVAQRSLEKIDYIELHAFGGSGLYLYRVMTCYYVVAFGDNSVAVTHLASCPSSSHATMDRFTPLLRSSGGRWESHYSRPLNEFGVRIEDLGDTRPRKK